MTSVHSRFGELRAAGGFLGGLRPFLQRRLPVAEAHGRLTRQLAARETTFLRVLQRAVFEHSASPYRKLFAWAGISPDDVASLLTKVGLQGTLERLHDAGVYVALEEFKGMRPLRRPGLELPLRAEDFDNPLSVQQYEVRTGGSGGTARRILVGLDLLEHESAYHAGFYAASGAAQRALAMWLPAPPGAVGIKNALICAKLGKPVERWFSQSRPGDAPLRHGAFAKATRIAAGLWGSTIPSPEFTPAHDAGSVALWLAEQCAGGTPAILLTTPSSAVRVAGHATERGIGIKGTRFVLVGEPYTVAKAQVIAAARSSGSCHYAMVEAGMIGLACDAPSASDDVHLVSDKVATIQRDKAVGKNGSMVGALFHTTLLPAAPKVMLNVESGDYGVLEERICGCGVLPPAFRSHLHTIRSYEKLTSEGMHFMGTDLLQLVETVLPAKFGGRATDYQMVEREVQGLPKVSLIVSPSIGALDPEEVVRTTLDFLRHRGIGQHLMAEVWSNGETLQVVRAEPHVTAAGKIQPLQKLS